MYYPTTRVLAVLALLQSHRRIKGADLANRLEVDVRTLRRYITTLQDLGVPILAERGRNGAYILDEVYIPPLFFTNDEVVALTMGLLAAKKLGVAEMIPAVESVRSKLEQSMPPQLKAHIQDISQSITLDTRPIHQVALNQSLLLMSTAVQQQRKVDLVYQSRNQEESGRTIAPYGIVFYQSHWYAVGYCDLREALRSFRLERVLAISLTDDLFKRPSKFDPLEYVIQSNATLPRTYLFRVELRADANQLKHESIHHLGTISGHENGFLLQGTVDDLDWLARELSLLSCSFKVIAPNDLKEAVRRRAQELLNSISDKEEDDDRRI
ncbi:MAG: YafY family protein [Chloroflexota bacterium]